ncbi:hypothetical protein KRP22_014891 [Phytophthora ramorum]|nr:hypothetical protein KRP22_14054 [Phytophthora ramorum]
MLCEYNSNAPLTPSGFSSEVQMWSSPGLKLRLATLNSSLMTRSHSRPRELVYFWRFLGVSGSTQVLMPDLVGYVVLAVVLFLAKTDAVVATQITANAQTADC